VLTRFIGLFLVLGVLASGLAPRVGTAAEGDPGPPLEEPVAKLSAAFVCPAGLHHPEHRPVLLVHGTSVTVQENWGWTYIPALKQAGYDVCTVQMPDYAFVDVQVSAEYVVYAIRQTARLSKQRISVVGLSQGGIEPRWALKWWPDIHDYVASYVGMATPNHGSVYGNGCAGSCIPSVWQQAVGANLIKALNRGNEAPYIRSVAYTTVYSRTDDIIQPAYPAPTGAVAGGSNIAVQDICPGRYVGHIQSMWDAVYYAVVMDALSQSGPADPGRVDRAVCLQQGMPGVDAITGATMTAELYAIAVDRQSVYPGRNSGELPLRCYAVVPPCSTPSQASTATHEPGGAANAATGLPNTSSAGDSVNAWALVVFGLIGLAYVRPWRRLVGARWLLG
jgi:hypothetical protein